MTWNKWTGLALLVLALICLCITLGANVSWLGVVTLVLAVAGVLFFRGKKKDEENT